MGLEVTWGLVEYMMQLHLCETRHGVVFVLGRVKLFAYCAKITGLLWSRSDLCSYRVVGYIG